VVATTASEEWEEAFSGVADSAAGAVGLDQLEGFPWAVASTQRLRRSVACPDPLEWESTRGGVGSHAALFAACLPLMDELRSVTPSIAQESGLVGRRIVQLNIAMPLGTAGGSGSIDQPTLSGAFTWNRLFTGVERAERTTFR